jgi:hypothetical protein
MVRQSRRPLRRPVDVETLAVLGEFGKLRDIAQAALEPGRIRERSEKPGKPGRGAIFAAAFIYPPDPARPNRDA